MDGFIAGLLGNSTSSGINGIFRIVRAVAASDLDLALIRARAAKIDRESVDPDTAIALPSDLETWEVVQAAAHLEGPGDIHCLDVGDAEADVAVAVVDILVGSLALESLAG